MARKRWSPKTDITPSLLKSREKRKWQIAFRRYVIEKWPCTFYAPYFGLDINNIRSWFECQFKTGIGWDDFGEKWQFDHIIPVKYFDFGNDEDLKMCWNFTNISIQYLEDNKDSSGWMDLLIAKNYFRELYQKTGYTPCFKLLQKINQVEMPEILHAENQQKFINEHKNYLNSIAGYSSSEFEMLNSGRDLTAIMQEIEFLKKFEK